MTSRPTERLMTLKLWIVVELMTLRPTYGSYDLDQWLNLMTMKQTYQPMTFNTYWF